MRTVIFEPDHRGHHLTYVGRLIPALRTCTDDIALVVSPKAPESAEFKAQIGPVASLVRVAPTAPVPDGRGLVLIRQWIDALRWVVREHRPEALYLPSADGLAQSWGFASLVGAGIVPKGLHIEGAMHRAAFAYSGPDVQRRVPPGLLKAGIARSRWSRLHFVDHLAYAWAERQHGNIARFARLLPDPVDPVTPIDRQQARARLALPPEGRLIGCAGVIDTRKGIDLLIRAFASARRSATDRLLLAGRASPEIKTMLPEFEPLIRSGHIVMMDRYISDAELQDALASMDVVCCPYPNHVGLSNITLRAAALERPILGSTFGWLNYIVPLFKLGWSTPVGDGAAFSRAIERSLDEASDWRPMPAVKRLLEFHSVQNFGASWAAGLRERLGGAPPSGLVEWSWVIEGLRDR